MTKTAYIMRGIPGSGKSTVARDLAGSTGHIHSTDELSFINGAYVFQVHRLKELHADNYNNFVASLEEGIETVICDNTNMQVWEFEKYAKTARDNGYHVVIVTMPFISVEEAAKRNTHNVPAESIRKMIQKWEPYTDDFLEKELAKDGKKLNYTQWSGLKTNLNQTNHKPPLVSERDIWWSSIGVNIGSEMYGKSDKFSRPVVIYKKLSHGFYMVIPTSTKEKVGSWYVPIVHGGVKMVMCLHQARVIDYRRLQSKIGQIDTGDFNLLEDGFKKLYTPNKYTPSRI